MGMAEHARLVRLTRFYPDDSQRQAAISEMQALVDRYRDVEGCFGAQVCTIEEEPGAVAVISRWESAEALRRLQGTDAARDVQDRLARVLTQPGKTEHFTSV
jgi:quinol monooxygenase YgiN